MVMMESSLLVAINRIGAGFTAFSNEQFRNLAPHILSYNNAEKKIIITIMFYIRIRWAKLKRK